MDLSQESFTAHAVRVISKRFGRWMFAAPAAKLRIASAVLLPRDSITLLGTITRRDPIIPLNWCVESNDDLPD